MSSSALECKEEFLPSVKDEMDTDSQCGEDSLDETNTSIVSSAFDQEDSAVFVTPRTPLRMSWMGQNSGNENYDPLGVEGSHFSHSKMYWSSQSPTHTLRNVQPASVEVEVSWPYNVDAMSVKSPSISSCENMASSFGNLSDNSDSHTSSEFCCDSFSISKAMAHRRIRRSLPPPCPKKPRIRTSLPTPRELAAPVYMSKNTTETMMKRFENAGPFIDSHCHIDFLLAFSNTWSWQTVLDRHVHHRPRNFRGFVQVFCNPKRFRPDDPILRMLRKVPDVWFTFGAHPKRLFDWSPQVLEALRECLVNVPRVVALGEVGLDYSSDFYKRAEQQKEALRQQLDLAIALNLPIVLHCREGDPMIDMDADEDLIRILKGRVPREHPMHLHCFTRDWQRAQRWLLLFPHLMIGLTPLIVKSETATEVAKNIPLDRLLIETDAPFFLPEEIDRRELGESLPWFAIIVAEKVAQLRDLSLDTVLNFVLSNTHRLYQLNRASVVQKRMIAEPVEFDL